MPGQLDVDATEAGHQVGGGRRRHHEAVVTVDEADDLAEHRDGRRVAQPVGIVDQQHEVRVVSARPDERVGALRVGHDDDALRPALGAVR